jgi:hypothetical protein
MNDVTNALIKQRIQDIQAAFELFARLDTMHNAIQNGCYVNKLAN